jgi:GTP-binding protein HflX
MRARKRERVLLVGVANRATPRHLAEEHLDELARLAETAGGDVVGRFVQERAAPDPATYIGKGAAETLGRRAEAERADLVVFDDELTPGQARNLEERWGDNVRVLDRPGLILDVFATHARSREARTQVELAQLQYLLPRLAGRYRHLSGLSGGIGARGGAGEQKLELDRRKIRDRIAHLRRDLEKIDTAREVRRRGRQKVFQVAIAGYTNAGKTTLFNRLTRETGYAADRLFATLDARAARGAAASLAGIVFLDTVGFVRKLPTSLVASFRSTLAEIRDADLVLHVLDASSPRVDEELCIAQEVLEELGVQPERILPVWNKTDVLGAARPPGGLRISALVGAGLPELTQAILRRARPEPDRFRLRIPYADGRAIAAARARFRVLSEEDAGDALALDLAGERGSLGRFRPYLEE